MKDKIFAWGCVAALLFLLAIIYIDGRVQKQAKRDAFRAGVEYTANHCAKRVDCKVTNQLGYFTVAWPGNHPVAMCVEPDPEVAVPTWLDWTCILFDAEIDSILEARCPAHCR